MLAMYLAEAAPVGAAAEVVWAPAAVPEEAGAELLAGLLEVVIVLEAADEEVVGTVETDPLLVVTATVDLVVSELEAADVAMGAPVVEEPDPEADCPIQLVSVPA